MSTVLAAIVFSNNIVNQRYFEKAIKPVSHQKVCLQENIVFSQHLVFDGKVSKDSKVELCKIEDGLYRFVIEGTKDKENDIEMLFFPNADGGVARNASRDGIQFMVKDTDDLLTFIVDFSDTLNNNRLKIKSNYNGHFILDSIYSLSQTKSIHTKQINDYSSRYTIKPGEEYYRRFLY